MRSHIQTILAVIAGFLAFLVVTVMEALSIGQTSGWLGMFFFIGVFVMVLHRLQLRRRHS